MRLLTLSLVAILASLAHARTQELRSRADQPIFRSGARLVQVSIIVHDGRRRPVEGLSRTDFRVFEDGKEQRVALFEVHTRTARVNASASPASDGADTAPGTFSNRIPSPAASGVVAIIFDQMNMGLMAQSRARVQLLRYLQRLRPTDRAALYALTGEGLRLLYDYTNDSSILIEALNRVQRGESRELVAAQDQPSAALTQALSAFALANIQNTDAYLKQRRSETTITALEDIGRHLEGIPGRKNIIWLSTGFPFRFNLDSPAGAAPSPMHGETGRATRALNNSDAAVYPIDVRGLLPPSFAKEVSQLGMLHVPIEGLKAFADWTGGRLFFNTNDLTGAMEQAVEDSRASYTLGYYSTNEALDGSFRKIKVSVQRRNVEVRHRSGYYAMDRVVAPVDRQSVLAGALNSPLVATGLQFSVRPTTKADGRIELAIELPPGSPALSGANDAWTGAVDVVVAQTTQSGERIRDMDATQPVSLTEQGRVQVQQKGLRLIRTITLRPDAIDIRVVVRDTTTGTIGSVVVPVASIR